MSRTEALNLPRHLPFALPARTSGFVLMLALLVLWEVSARGWITSDNWPPFSHVLAAVEAGVRSGELPQIFASSLTRMTIGFSIGAAVAVTMGLLMGRWRWLYAAFNPLVEFMRPIPIPAIVPPLILLLGIGASMKIFVVALGVFSPILINTLAGVRSVDKVSLDVARTFQVSSVRTLFRVILPASMPFIMAGLRTSLAFALIITVIAEMIAASEGIGYHIVTLQYAMRAADMYAAILVLAVIGYLLNYVSVRIERRTLHWFQRAA